MIGTILWNVIGGLVAFVGTFLLSIQTNLFITSFLRGLYSFVIMFVLLFVARWVIGLLLHTKNPVTDVQASKEIHKETEQSHVGKHFDLVTPDEDTNASSVIESDFSPLNPPKLETKTESDPERLAQAVRHLSAN